MPLRRRLSALKTTTVPLLLRTCQSANRVLGHAVESGVARGRASSLLLQQKQREKYVLTSTDRERVKARRWAKEVKIKLFKYR